MYMGYMLNAQPNNSQLAIGDSQWVNLKLIKI